MKWFYEAAKLAQDKRRIEFSHLFKFAQKGQRGGGKRGKCVVDLILSSKGLSGNVLAGASQLQAA